MIGRVMKTATFLAIAAVMVGGPAAGQDPPRSAKPEDKPSKKKTVAILVFDGMELLDFAGPAEVFIVSDYGKAFRVVTVAAEKKTVRAMGGIAVEPQFSFQDAPQPDVIVVPGGNTANVGPQGIAWLKTSSKQAEIVMSVCMGAFVLARAGLLDGMEATTHHWGIESLKRAAPECKVVTQRRFVDSGKVITTAGVTAGIDGALHVVERLLGAEAARWTAEEWMEHKRAAVPAP